MAKSTFSDLSLDLTKSLDTKTKKDNGIYFTPVEIVENTLSLLNPFIKNIKTVLEPSCGSCEYIIGLDSKHKGLDITGIELNKQIFSSIEHINERKNIQLYNSNFLTHTFTTKYDLIIGNPPYFVMKDKSEIDPSYKKYFTGRANIFIIFMIKSLEILNENGILSFVLPKSFLNCLYYNKTRVFIRDNFQICHIVDCTNGFKETNQNTIILILQKLPKDKIKNNDNILELGENIILDSCENVVSLKKLLENSTTLEKLGAKLSIGDVVWNQRKRCNNTEKIDGKIVEKEEKDNDGFLTEDTTKPVLIYSSDIIDGKISIKNYKIKDPEPIVTTVNGKRSKKSRWNINKDKLNHVNMEGDEGPLLVVMRGYGNGDYKFNYCLINEKFKYKIENHLIRIKYDNISDKKRLELYDRIVKSFENEKTKEFIELYFSNNAMNATELHTILPIY